MTVISTATRICAIDDLTPGLGVAALVDGVQVALFLLPDGSVRCVQNLDPYSGASVMSRGIVGSRGGVPTLASPLYKQVFSLDDGRCLASMDAEPVAGLSGDLIMHHVDVYDSTVVVELSDGR